MTMCCSRISGPSVVSMDNARAAVGYGLVAASHLTS